MKVSNTLSGRKEDFVPENDPVQMYVCGVTPYSDCHIGHAMSYIVFDVVRRYLEFRGFRVRYVQNFTDVDDKIIARSNQLGIATQELAEGFISQYFADMDGLNIGRADVYPKATEEVPKIIEVIQGLIEKGHAYESDGDVYFRVKSLADYGKLSHRSIDEMRAAEEGMGKEHPMDFALWKGAKPGEPKWESPWGEGRPGWHIECSAMCLRYLGENVDIHGGGQDLVFPHHENEIAQAEAFTGSVPFVKYWLHNGLLQLGEEKMSKSLGNLITVKEALERWSADAIRLFILSSHYRSPLTYTEEGLEAAERGAERLRLAARRDASGPPPTIDVADHRQTFVNGMDDDFNTAQAVAGLFDLAREINRAAEAGSSVGEAQQLLVELGGVLGLTLEEPKVLLDAAPFARLLQEVNDELRRLEPDLAKEVFEGDSASGSGADATAEDIISTLVEARARLRSRRRFDIADKIRQNLTRMDIGLEDTDRGTVWRHRR